VVLGDGEEIALPISELVRSWKSQGRPGRDGLLLLLVAGGAVYMPKFYDVEYTPHHGSS